MEDSWSTDCPCGCEGNRIHPCKVRERNIAESPPDICHCICHYAPGVMHVMLCCRPCETCGKRVKTGSEAQHLAYCRPGDRTAEQA